MENLTTNRAFNIIEIDYIIHVLVDPTIKLSITENLAIDTCTYPIN